jgi:hypothetical protein
MSLALALVLMLAGGASAKPDDGPWTEYQKDPVVPQERLGPGPYTLVIVDRDAMTRIDYKTGPACQKARDEVRRQVAPPPNTRNVIYGPPTTKAFCVPR